MRQFLCLAAIAAAVLLTTATEASVSVDRTDEDCDLQLSYLDIALICHKQDRPAVRDIVNQTITTWI